MDQTKPAYEIIYDAMELRHQRLKWRKLAPVRLRVTKAS